MFDVQSVPSARPARNALKPVCVQFNIMIYISISTPTQRAMHGRRAFILQNNLANMGLVAWRKKLANWEGNEYICVMSVVCWQLYVGTLIGRYEISITYFIERM